MKKKILIISLLLVTFVMGRRVNADIHNTYSVLAGCAMSSNYTYLGWDYPALWVKPAVGNKTLFKINVIKKDNGTGTSLGIRKKYATKDKAFNVYYDNHGPGDYRVRFIAVDEAIYGEYLLYSEEAYRD